MHSFSFAFSKRKICRSFSTMYLLGKYSAAKYCWEILHRLAAAHELSDWEHWLLLIDICWVANYRICPELAQAPAALCQGLSPHTVLRLTLSQLLTAFQKCRIDRERRARSDFSCCKFFCLHNSGQSIVVPWPDRCLQCGCRHCVVLALASHWSLTPRLGLWLVRRQPGQCKHCHIPVPGSGSSLNIFSWDLSLPPEPGSALHLWSWWHNSWVLTSVVRLPAAVIRGPRVFLLTQILSSWQPRPLAHSKYYNASLLQLYYTILNLQIQLQAHKQAEDESKSCIFMTTTFFKDIIDCCFCKPVVS